jgi:hypothetical protein
MGADQVVALAEAGFTWVPDLESKNDLLYDVPGTYTHANPLFTAAGIQPATTPRSQFADEFSWGYRAVARADYNDVIASVNLQPQIAFSHDVNGNTPGPGGNFIEGRKAVTLSLSADYLNDLRATVSYSNFFDGGVNNQLKDRDFVSFTVSYAF